MAARTSTFKVSEEDNIVRMLDMTMVGVRQELMAVRTSTLKVSEEDCNVGEEKNNLAEDSNDEEE